MRVLLDECLPRRLKQHLGGHDVSVVEDLGWKGRRNGELLKLSARKFDALLTVDARFSKPSAEQPAVVLLRATGNDFESLEPLLPKLLEVLSHTRMGEFVAVD